ncbi:MAG: universal stress protein [Chloroflexi bacterium]|nr:universal stress protein [Chloroflexota bacterium]
MNQTNQHTGGIICATRGGEGSESAVQGAIKLARERGLGLTFLYIVDLNFMKRTTAGRTDLVADELRKMGEFIMLTLVEQAQAEGIKADFATRKGRFRDELVRYLEETHPATLVLGRPKPGTAYLDASSLDRLTQEIKEQTGVSVELI